MTWAALTVPEKRAVGKVCGSLERLMEREYEKARDHAFLAVIHSQCAVFSSYS